MEKIENKFIRYVKIDTESSETSFTYPSTDKQLKLANLLKDELIDMGIKNAYVDEFGLVYAQIDGDNSLPKIGLIAHMDTAPTIRGGNFDPRFVYNYNGDDIKLNNQYTLSSNQFPHLKKFVGKTLIVTDGEHLLGGDDKAGIAIIMSLCEYYSKVKINHAPIRICFTPDEEISAGADHFSCEKMDADIAYTLDGGDIEEINFENFNAASCHVSIKGVGIHPGSAKDIMVNACLLAMEFNSLLDPNAIPSKTELYQGFNHLDYIKGDVESCELDYIIRNHDEKLLKKQEQEFIKAQEIIKNKYPTCAIEVTLKEQYRNMKYYFEKDSKALDLITAAYKKVDQKYHFDPIRGGTDGARITYMGLPCPNIGTGDYCCHGRYEHVVVEQMYQMFNICKALLEF